jgi:putative oxidoreductase
MTSIYILLAFFVIVFGQSAIDKVINFKSELAFLKQHFSKTILSKTVPIMLVTITLLELGAALSGILAITEIARAHHFGFAKISGTLAAASLLSLLLGQRIAKDYAGAMTIVVYLIPTLLFWILIERFQL